jgi:metal-dependent amidase/aminoacylase/carboxypeptidase family protein
MNIAVPPRWRMVSRGFEAGHDIIAAASAGAAVALHEVAGMRYVTIKLIGTPAEEPGGWRCCSEGCSTTWLWR